MKRLLKLSSVAILVAGAIAALAYSLAANGFLATEPPPAATTLQVAPTPEIPLRKLDPADVLENIRFHKEYAIAAEKQALAEYDASNASSVPWYENGRIAVILFVYWAVGGDFYEEGLLQTADDYAAAAYKKGCRDPLILAICDVHTFQERFSIKLAGASKQLENSHKLAASGYPTICKARTAIAGFRNTAKFLSPSNREDWKEDMTPAGPNLSTYMTMVFAELGALIKAGCPEELAYSIVESLVSSAQRSPDLMQTLSTQLDASLASAGASPGLRALCRGSFLTEWAWTARGSGWSDTVTEVGWRLMAERLSMAQRALEQGEKDSPKDPNFPIELLSVELGQGVGKYRMERLFQQAVTIDPGNYQAYSRKMYYLQPRWHGSPREVLEFGLACVNSDKWSDKIPLVFVEGVELMADQDQRLYEHPKIWETVNFVLQKYLEKYPQSIGLRTEYLEWAVKSKNWETARQQQQILGAHWDRSKLSQKEYGQLTQAIPAS